MAKKKKYPKMPRRSASLEVWKRYREKVKEVDRYNADLDKAKKEKERIIAEVQKLR